MPPDSIRSVQQLWLDNILEEKRERKIDSIGNVHPFVKLGIRHSPLERRDLMPVEISRFEWFSFFWMKDGFCARKFRWKLKFIWMRHGPLIDRSMWHAFRSYDLFHSSSLLERIIFFCISVFFCRQMQPIGWFVLISDKEKKSNLNPFQSAPRECGSINLNWRVYCHSKWLPPMIWPASMFLSQAFCANV